MNSLLCSVPYDRNFGAKLALAFARIVNYYSFIVQATVITIVNCDRNTFTVRASGIGHFTM